MFHVRGNGRRGAGRDSPERRHREHMPWRNRLLLLVGLAGLLCGLALGQGLVIAGGLMVSTAALLNPT